MELSKLEYSEGGENDLIEDRRINIQFHGKSDDVEDSKFKILWEACNFLENFDGAMIFP
jgi:hypothetical protein